MYNDIILIVLSVFAVYGMYSVVREFFKMLCKKEQLVVAIRITDYMNKNKVDDIFTIAEGYISEHYILERRPVIICDAAKRELFDTFQYDVYVKYTEEK